MWDNKTANPLTWCQSYVFFGFFFFRMRLKISRKLRTVSCGLEEVATSSLILTLLLYPLSAWHPHSTHPHTGQKYPAREKNCHGTARLLPVLHIYKHRECECVSQRKWKSPRKHTWSSEASQLCTHGNISMNIHSAIWDWNLSTGRD